MQEFGVIIIKYLKNDYILINIMNMNIIRQNNIPSIIIKNDQFKTCKYNKLNNYYLTRKSYSNINKYLLLNSPINNGYGNLLKINYNSSRLNAFNFDQSTADNIEYFVKLGLKSVTLYFFFYYSLQWFFYRNIRKDLEDQDKKDDK